VADLATFVKRIGAAIVFGESSSTTILGSFTTTNALSLDALAAGSGRMSVEKDLGTDLPEFLLLQASVETGTAPTAGGTVEWYLAWSMDGTNYPAGVTGADGAWPADGNEDEWRAQLGPPALVLVATNDATVIQIQNAVLVPVRGRYFSVVCDNNLSQAIRDEATASNNASGLVAWPVNLVATD
jgi:hypothetical protein